MPQVARDGFVAFDGEDDVQAFDAVDFPLAIGREAMALAEFSTQIVSSPAGHEQRASEWAEARMRYDAGPGIRSEADVRTLVDFFRARRGAARAFRFRDPFDASSAADGGLPSAGDQMLGVRPQGYDPATGLDCVGLVWAAYAAAGRRLIRPSNYPLRGWSEERIAEALARAGFIPADGTQQSGDVALVALAAGQFHLALMGPDRCVHAHAGLRRVVESPLDHMLLAAPRWRLVQEN